MSTPCYYGELDQDNCSFFIHGVDVQDAIRQAHRAGWERAKAEAADIAHKHRVHSTADSIAAMEYKEPTNDCTRI